MQLQLPLMPRWTFDERKWQARCVGPSRSCTGAWRGGKEGRGKENWYGHRIGEVEIDSLYRIGEVEIDSFPLFLIKKLLLFLPSARHNSERGGNLTGGGNGAWPCERAEDYLPDLSGAEKALGVEFLFLPSSFPSLPRSSQTPRFRALSATN